MTIERFEDLECWQEARKLTNMGYAATRKAPFARDYRLRDQITGAGISAMNNIAEGFGAQSNSVFIQFLGYARRSVCEVQSCAYVALDQGYVPPSLFEQIYQQADKTVKIVDGFLCYLRSHQRSRVSQRS